MAEDDLQVYNFTSNNKIKSMLVSPQNHDLISRGRIAIVKLVEADEEAFFLIPADAATKIKERSDEAVVLLNEPLSNKENDSDNNDNAAEDDPYAGFEVPDDLMW